MNGATPIANKTVQLYSGNTLLASATTDGDGSYLINYKVTGKAATFTVKVPACSPPQSTTVQLKANGYAVVNFTVC